MGWPPTWLRSLALLSAFALCAPGCGDEQASSKPVLAILSAFPAEMAAVLERATVDETRTVDGRVFRLGRIGRARVVIAMTGIGLVNAGATTRVLLDHFDVAGVVVSAVAGSPFQIGDVTVPATWVLDDGSRYLAHAPWLEVTEEIATAGKVSLESCAIIPDVVLIAGVTPGTNVCFPYEPRVVVGGIADSSDLFGDKAFECVPGGDDVFACDRDVPVPFLGVSVGPEAPAALALVEPDTRTAYDMETAAIAREVASRGLPFIAFRAASDGGSDPFGLSGFVQFFAYYRLAAHNAAAAAVAFVESIG